MKLRPQNEKSLNAVSNEKKTMRVSERPSFHSNSQQSDISQLVVETESLRNHAESLKKCMRHSQAEYTYKICMDCESNVEIFKS